MSVWQWILKLIRGEEKAVSLSVSIPITKTGYLTPPKWEAFIDKIRPMAEQIQAETGIPWNFTMIQAAHESRYGESKLTKEACNLFGFTGDSWVQMGKPVYWIQTSEYDKEKKVWTKPRRPFRKYASWEESLADWAGLVKRRYPKALEAARLGDFNAFAAALQQGGYATDPEYAKHLVKLNDTFNA